MSLVEVTADAEIVTFILNRPEARNALSLELCDAIVSALDAADALDARVAVLRGAGPAFCSGADVAAVSGPGASNFLPAFERMLDAVDRFRLPTIAAIHGAALGGGFQLATVCDFRIAAEDAKIGIPSSKIGIVVNFDNIERLVILAGAARAKEVLMTGRTYSGIEAAAAGLVNRSVSSDELDDAVDTFARGIASLAPLSVQGAKRAIGLVWDNLRGSRVSDPERVAEIDRLVVEAYASHDLGEGLAAMTEKRKPKFTGR